MHLERCDCCGDVRPCRALEGDRLCLPCRFYHRHPGELKYARSDHDCCRSALRG